MTPYTHPSQTTYYIYPKPKSLGLFLGLLLPTCQFCAVNHKGNFLRYLAWAQCRQPSSHLGCPTSHLVSHLKSGLTYSIPEKGRKVAEKFLFDADWKTTSAVKIPEELSCLCLVAAEHQKTVFNQMFMGCLKIEVLRDGGNRNTISPSLFCLEYPLPST